jgi:hypothetical protein
VLLGGAVLAGVSVGTFGVLVAIGVLLAGAGALRGRPGEAAPQRARTARVLSWHGDRRPGAPGVGGALSPSATDAGDLVQSGVDDSRAGVDSGGVSRERRMPDASARRVAALLSVSLGRARARGLLRRELDVLDARSWLVEYDMRLGGVTIAFVLFGPTGVFALTASETWVMGDLSVLRAAADELAGALPGYPDPVRAVLYVPREGGGPRWWCNGHGDAAWIVGAGGIAAFLAEFDDQGLSADDIAALRAFVAVPALLSLHARLPANPGVG